MSDHRPTKDDQPAFSAELERGSHLPPADAWPANGWLNWESDEGLSGSLSFGAIFGTAAEAPPVDRAGFSLASLSVGDEFAGYRLLVRLGKGAFGRVYLAEECNLARRLVVVKISERQLEEPHALARLQHSHIVPIYSLHDDPLSGLQAVVMPYLGGTTLDVVLRSIGDPTKTALKGQDLLDLVDAHTLATVRRLYEGETPQGQPYEDAASASGHSRQASCNWSVSVPTHREHVSVALHASQTPGKGGEPHLHSFWSRLRSAFRLDPDVPGVSARDTLARTSYEQAVQWLGARLAEALHHAHSRGVLHRDVKPGNILLAQDGRPLLLDFNLADIATGGKKTKAIGGTLAYMAPEHLRAFKAARKGRAQVDERADIFSLGVVLYELLAGMLPFESATGDFSDEQLDRLIESRYVSPPRLRKLNPRVSPSLEAVVSRCLEPDPEKRYQSAAELAEDLQREFDGLPLRYSREPCIRYRARKWVRRHPRLTVALVAACAVGLVTGIALTTVKAAGARVAAVESRLARSGFRQQYETARSLAYAALGAESADLYRAALSACDRALQSGDTTDGRGGTDSNQTAAKLYFLRAVIRRAMAQQERDPRARVTLYERALSDLERSMERVAEPRRYTLALKAELLALLGRSAEAEQLSRLARQIPLRDAEDYYVEGSRLLARGAPDKAVEFFEEALRADPSHFWAMFGLAQAYSLQGKFSEAQMAYIACLAVAPRSALVYLNRGNLYARQRRFEEAIADYSRAIEFDPELAAAYSARGQAYLQQRKWRQAASDFSYALRFGLNTSETHAAYATALAQLGEFAAACEHFDLAYRMSSRPDSVALAAAAALADCAPRTALEWTDRVLRTNPEHARAWYVRACLLTEHLHRDHLALDAVRRSLEIEPLYPSAIVLECLLLARTGRHGDALQRAAIAENLTLTGADWYVLASAYAVLGRDRPELLSRSVTALEKAADAGADMRRLQTDPDFSHLRADPSLARTLDELVRRASAGEKGD